jgi:nifR3 family TIM-barrel protein
MPGYKKRDTLSPRPCPANVSLNTFLIIVVCDNYRFWQLSFLAIAINRSIKGSPLRMIASLPDFAYDTDLEPPGSTVDRASKRRITEAIWTPLPVSGSMIQPCDTAKSNISGTLRIGSLEVAHPFVQAALSGYTDLAMRRMARAHGAAYCINEVVLDRSVLHDGPWQRKLLTVEPDDHPVGAQLMGGDPTTFGPAADRMVDAGYDVIDINFGCPAPKAQNRCRGGFLLSEPETAAAIVCNVVDAVGDRCPVTLKMRRGLDDSAESERGFFKIFDLAFSLGVAAITVHGRSVEQRYRGPSDWRFLARVKESAGKRTVLGSGDLFTADDCVRMMEETGVDGVTIARGSMGNPWIFNQCLALARGERDAALPANPTIEQQRDTIMRHFEETAKLHGHEKAGKLMGKFGVRYANLHPKRKRVREAFSRKSSTEQFLETIRIWYDDYR